MSARVPVPVPAAGAACAPNAPVPAPPCARRRDGGHLASAPRPRGALLRWLALAALGLGVFAAGCPAEQQATPGAGAADAPSIDVGAVGGDGGTRSPDGGATISDAGTPPGADGASKEDVLVPDAGGPDAPTGTKGGFGDPCSGAADCESGLCTDGATGGECTSPCGDGCPDGWVCDTAADGEDGVCRSRAEALCNPCRTNAECTARDAGARCIARGDEGSFCGLPCDGGCPTGTACFAGTDPDGAAIEQCMPKGGDACTCRPSAIERSLETGCRRSDTNGSCTGTRFCTAGGLSACDAPSPAPEACGGGDEDCDGEVDEEGAAGCTPWYLDVDDDGFGLASGERCLCAADGDTRATVAGDCDDDDAAVLPGAPCASASCVDSMLTPASVCQADGSCTETAPAPCPSGFVCASESACAASCTGAAECASGHTCTDGACVPLLGAGSPCAVDGQCTTDHCDGVCCAAGECCAAATDCDDGNVCTTDACVGNQCEHTPNDAPCSAPTCEGLALLGTATCTGGVCGAPPVTDCGGDDPCKVFGCDPLLGCTTASAAAGAPCGVPSCVGFELAAAKTCDGLGGCTLGGGAEPCPGGTTCLTETSCRTQCTTQDHCAPGTTCQDTACVPLVEDGGECTKGALCASGHCEGGLCCQAGECCATDADCDDGNVCTTDSCVDSQCEHEANTAPCSTPTCSGTTWHGVATCADGVCGAAPSSACGGTDPCKTSSCDPVLGCQTANAPIGAVCGPPTCEGSLLTAQRVCDGLGTCAEAGPAEPCPGGTACLTGTACRTQCTQADHCAGGFTCEANSCTPKRDDGEDCTKDAQCTSGHCGGGVCCAAGDCCKVAADCDDADVCTSDVCVDHQCGHAANTATCAPSTCAGLTWMGASTCASGACETPSGTDCTGTDPCKQHGCDPALGCTVSDAPEGKVCGAPSCEGYLLSSSQSCDGLGGCTLGAGTEPCPGGTTCLTATTCRTVCTAPEHCAPGWFCEATACKPEREDGQACSKDVQCAAGHCAGGFCCASGVCCGEVADCDDGNPCTAETCTNHQCSWASQAAECAAPKCVGLEHVSASTCESGACSAPVTQSCGGTDPCRVYGCDAALGCTDSLAEPGTICGPKACDGYLSISESECDASGACGTGSVVSPCAGGLVCKNEVSCRTYCVDDSHCQSGYYCDMGACKAERANGTACAADAECKSGHCQGGFCCASGLCCNGDDALCNDGNSCTDDTCTAAFTCSSTPNASECASPACAGLTYTAPMLCVEGTCSAGGQATSCQGSDPCKVYTCTPGGCAEANAGAGGTCKVPSCEGYTLTAALSCDGLGGCSVGGGAEPCPNGYACLNATSCRTQCQDDTHCALGSYCKAGKCTAGHEDGQKCAASNECVSGHCANGHCCASGVCCGDASQCDDGDVCTTDTCVDFQCQSADNTDLCAAGACNGLSYSPPRTCGGGACGEASSADCSGTAPCKVYGCDPASGCSVADSAAGTPCGAGSCSGYTLTSGSACDGSGQCVQGGAAGPCPGGFVCANSASCLTACGGDSDCRLGFFCQATVCLPKRGDGEGCTAGAQCLSDHCANGFCCASGKCCGGNDAHCNDSNVCTDDVCGSSYQCVSTPNAAVCAQASCQGTQFTSPTVCSAGLCASGGGDTDCQGSNPCKVYGCGTAGCTAIDAPVGQLCAAPKCSGYLLTSNKTCDGTGSCSNGGVGAPCPGGFACLDASTCRTQCTQDAHCAPTTRCVGQACVSKTEDGGTCAVDGECLSGHCGGGICCSGATCCAKDADCYDGDECTDDVCTGWSCSHTPNTAPCSASVCDGLTFHASSVCEDGVCVPMAPESCSGPIDLPCMDEGCDHDAGCTSAPSAVGTVCAPGSCLGGYLIQQARLCDGGGTCLPHGPSIECPGGYACLDAQSCRAECTTPAHCRSGYACIGGSCQPQKEDGQDCTSDDACLSGHCGGGVCCGAGQCCTTAEACDDGNPCTDDACAAFSCQHTPNTAPCGAPSCDGSVHLGVGTCNGGVCQPPASGEECVGTDPCLVYGCAPSGCTVAQAATGSPCGSGFCSGSTLTSGLVCDAAGACVPGAGTGPCPGGYACADEQSCRASCADDTHCRADFYCKSGICLPRADDGDTCTASKQCLSGYCANGFCCGSGKCCGGNDAQCAAAACGPAGFSPAETCGTDFRCATSPVVSCVTDSPCLLAGCNALTGCTLTPTPGVSCREPACADGMFTLGATCLADGECPESQAGSCLGGLLCKDATSCLTACGSDADCVVGSFCDMGNCEERRPDGEACTGNTQCVSEYCSGGACCVDDGTAPVCCSVGTPCTPASCAGLLHTTASTCDAASHCQPGQTQDCSGTQSCVEYGCSPSQGCTEVPSTPDVECGALQCVGYTMTPAPTCDGNGSCSDTPAAIPCPGGLVCASASACRVTCTTNAHCQPDHYCSGGVCKPLGQFGGACSDHGQCQSGYCSNGLCFTPGATCCSTPDVCDDGNPCTGNACVANTCSSTPLDGKVCVPGSCSAGSYTAQTTCLAGQCTEGGGTLSCDDGDGCTIDTCSPSGGCTHMPKLCNDGIVCTDDWCSSGDGMCHNDAIDGCCGDDGDCATGSPCTTGSCQIETGACVVTDNDGVPCNDENQCSEDDTCMSGLCVGVNVADATPCGTGLLTQCVSGSCECVPDCSQSECGTDGCGGSCGACPNSTDVCPTGVSPSWGCHCDGLCAVRGDCCGDYEEVCLGTPPSDSCEGACGAPSPGGTCSCEVGCEDAGDCCVDYRAKCTTFGDSCVGSCGSVCVPLGDSCANPFEVSSLPFHFAGTTEGLSDALHLTGQTCTDGYVVPYYATAGDAVYAFTAPKDAVYTVSGASDAFITYVFQLETCGVAPQCAAVDMGVFGAAVLHVTASAGETVFIAVDCGSTTPVAYTLDIGECVPDCAGRECGDDGCGGSCGGCSVETICNTAGLCVPPPPVLVVNEVDYDQPGLDLAEFVEIYNPSNHAVSLAGYVLEAVNGANNAVLATVDLSTIPELPAKSYLVVGQAPAVATVLSGTLTITVGEMLQNGSPDGVRLVRYGVFEDGLAYEGQMSGTGEGASPTVSDTGAGSLGRCFNGWDTNDNAKDFKLAATPTPGVPNVCPATCAGFCGLYNPDFPCQCDEACADAGDCCADVCAQCTDLVACMTVGDRCEKPFAVDTFPYVTNGTTVGAGDDYDPTSCAPVSYGTSGPDQVYAVTADTDDTYYFIVYAAPTSSGYGAIVYVLSGCAGTGGCASSANGSLTMNLQAGETALLVVDGLSGGFGSTFEGPYELAVGHSCVDSADCPVGWGCGGNGICYQPLPDGSGCSEDAGCESGHCNSYICCGAGTCCTTAAACNDGDACTTDTCSTFMCDHAPKTDSLEPNDTFPGSSVTGKNSCDTATSLLGATVFPDGDVDWYHYTSTDSIFCGMVPTVQLQVPSGADYDLCAYFECSSGATPTVTCTAGTPSTGPSSRPGCCSTGTGTTTELVRMQPSCGSGSFFDDSGVVSVKVTKKTGPAVCSTYTLSWWDE